MSGFEYYGLWLLGLLSAGAVAGYGVMEFIAWLEHSETVAVPAGFRFVSRHLQVEMQRAKDRVVVRTDRGHFVRQANATQEASDAKGAMTVVLEALGLRIEITPQKPLENAAVTDVPPRHFSLTFNNAEDHSRLNIPDVPAKIAHDFSAFASQIGLWVEKREARRAQEEAAAQAAAESAAAAAAAEAEALAAKAEKEAALNLPPDAQVALWRKAAGFSGTSSEIGLDDRGKIAWFIDLDPSGRITLHGNDRTVHTTLEGAEIASVGGELELGVRDEFWTIHAPKLVRFRVLKGRSPDERRAWRERMEILRNQLDAKNHAPLAH